MAPVEEFEPEPQPMQTPAANSFPKAQQEDNNNAQREGGKTMGLPEMLSKTLDQIVHQMTVFSQAMSLLDQRVATLEERMTTLEKATLKSTSTAHPSATVPTAEEINEVE
jgi:hypothetical protein